MESASSKITILYGGHGYELSSGTFRGVCLAKFLTFSLTIAMPRSSEALSSSTRERKFSGLKKESDSYENSQEQCERTQTIGAKGPELWMFYPFRADHRTACEEAMKRKVNESVHVLGYLLTLVDVNALRKTATVCSCAEISLMV